MDHTTEQLAGETSRTTAPAAARAVRVAGRAALASALLLTAGAAPAADGPEQPAPVAGSLPSAVSSDIERFVRANGLDRPPPASAPARPPLAGRPAQGTATRPAPLAPPRVAAAPAQEPGAGGGAPRATMPPGMPAGPRRADRAPATSPLAAAPRVQAPPLAPEDLRFPINLAAALRLSDARPLVVAAAQARVWVAEAALTQAKLLWVPDLNLGFSYIRHDGGGPDFNKGLMTAPSVNFFYAGAGLTGYIATTDAIYEPLVARQLLNAAHWDAQAAKNDALLRTAEAYFRVHRSRGTYASLLYTVGLGGKLVVELEALGRDLVPAYEVQRARNTVAELQQQAVSARERWRVDSASLTRVLRLDPRAVLEPLERDHSQVTLLDPARPLDDLMAVALANRPELGSRRASVAAAEAGIRREKARPLLPTVLLNGFQTPGGMLFQGGIFGLGPNGSLNQWVGRDDVSVQCIWQLENFGVGNLARIKAQRGMQSQAIVDLRRAQDRVAEEVTAARARLQSAAARVRQADRSVRAGAYAFNGAFEGLRQTSRFGDDVLVLISRPQEVVYALELLQRSFNEYFATVAEYNGAQFALFHALGYPAREVAELRLPGEPVPVDVARPGYLPPVGHGPPPATR
ncbi:Outer membrane efflux protein [Aquisphaera giovannonii]|uniref:Outer membrane efflux protein n=1 Tax=Aquisphaera giovannonii TaxID=406548 RepID=A0A5B9W4G7_9BACT|nr:TolC family protein [Aquisphaera giovannonii]QEH35117.1 Outer membrane efflux protein [Aquisphaera giovannonii]